MSKATTSQECIATKSEKIICTWQNRTDKEFESLIPKTELMDRFGLTECEDIWQRMSDRFISELHNQKELAEYYYSMRCAITLLWELYRMKG